MACYHLLQMPDGTSAANSVWKGSGGFLKDYQVSVHDTEARTSREVGHFLELFEDFPKDWAVLSRSLGLLFRGVGNSYSCMCRASRSLQ